MDDQHRQPREGDRKPVRDRITRAVRDGRISEADGEIRLTNVASAQSVGELDLIVRDLDQLDAVIPVAVPAVVTAAVGGASAMGVGPDVGPDVGAVVNAAASGVRRTLPLLVLGLAIAILGAGAIGLVVFSSTGGSSGSVSSGELPEPVPLSPTVDVDEPEPEPGDDPEPSGATYRLGGAGFKLFLADYRERFGTSKVVELTFYDDYVIVRVPVPGRQRNTGWRYADGAFDEFGPPMANFPGSAVLDTAKLDVAKLVRNIATALRTLRVEDGQVSHINLSYRPTFDEAPNVNIYVSNGFSESGYLATTLDGRVERAYPYDG